MHVGRYSGRISRPAALAAAVALVGAALFADAEGALAAATPSLFGTREIAKTDLKPFPKWTDSLDRFLEERQANKGACKKTATNKCFYTNWGKFRKSLKGKDPLEQIRAVNAFFNRGKYIVDPINWGLKDYWETPGEFFELSGDCEDYAVSKFHTLRFLGFKSEQLRVVIVEDLNLKVAHAILAVYLDDKILILDNQIKQVVDSATIRHYKPIYSVNQDGWWLHKPG